MMNFNDIREAEREGRLLDYSIVELRAMSQTCVIWMQSGSCQEAVHTKDSVDKEIERKEKQEAERRAAVAATERHEEAIALDRKKLGRVFKMGF